MDTTNPTDVGDTTDVADTTDVTGDVSDAACTEMYFVYLNALCAIGGYWLS